MSARQRRPDASLPDSTTLFIKNMVCNRCIRVVREELTGIGLDVRSVKLGEVVVGGPQASMNKSLIASTLAANGFELVEDRRKKLVEHIKHAVLRLVQTNHEVDPVTISTSQFIAQEVGQEYHYLSGLFSSLEGMTIEHYLILQKIERAKELLKYGELTLSEIAYQLGYSSVQHISGQFKQITGMTPSAFKRMVGIDRIPLDEVGSGRDR